MIRIKRLTGLVCSAASILALICLGGPRPALAQGQFIVEPRVDAGWRYDSNFHRSETNEQGVDTFFLKPGMALGYTTDKTEVTLDYDAKAYRYNDRDGVAAGSLAADDFNYVEHRAALAAESRISRRILLGVENMLWVTRDPANADANSNAVDRYKYTLNRFQPKLVYNFGSRFGMGLTYTNLITDYTYDAPGKGEDSEENRGGFTLFYYLNSDTSVDLDYQIWNRDYERASSDYDSQQVMVNVNKQFNYLTVSLGAGYHGRDFDENLAGGDIETFVWKLALAGQNPQDAKRRPRQSIYFSVGKNFNDAGSGNTYYEATRVDAAVSRLFFEKINLKLAGWYQNADYQTSSRKDDAWKASLTVDHWVNDALSWGVEGGLEERDSNQSGNDYDNRYLMVNVNFNYDMGSR